MNANQVIGLTLAASALVLGVCAWYMTRDEVVEQVQGDTVHFEHVTDQWNKARDSVNNEVIEITDRDEFYRNIHSQLDVYIREASFINEELREQLHGKNALFLSELV